MTYDVIGDIHGHAEELRTLLRQLGYEERNGGYVAEGRNAIFVGDFIDRGPAIREVLQIARAMVRRNGAMLFSATMSLTPFVIIRRMRPAVFCDRTVRKTRISTKPRLISLFFPIQKSGGHTYNGLRICRFFWRSTDCESFTPRGMKMRSA